MLVFLLTNDGNERKENGTRKRMAAEQPTITPPNQGRQILHANNFRGLRYNRILTQQTNNIPSLNPQAGFLSPPLYLSLQNPNQTTRQNSIQFNPSNRKVHQQHYSSECQARPRADAAPAHQPYAASILTRTDNTNQSVYHITISSRTVLHIRC